MKCRGSVEKGVTMWSLVLVMCLVQVQVQMSHAQGDEGARTVLEPRNVPECKIIPKNLVKVLTCYNHYEIPSNNDSVFSSDGPNEVGVLNFAGNSLTRLRQGEFYSSGMINLKEIDLSGNQIHEIHAEAFAGLNLLNKLDLSRNKIESLSLEAFGNLPNLKILKLNGNEIYKFAGNMFPPSTSLSELDMSNCKIRELPKQIFQNLAGLQHLSLSGNKLERLSWELFKNNNVLNIVRLENNPWKCDCHVKFLLQFFNKRKIEPGSVTCASPEEFNGSAWKTLPMDSLICLPAVMPLQTSLTNQEPEDHVGVDQIFMGYGKDVAFECIIEAYPKPDIKWLKDGRDLQLIAGEGSLSRNIGGGDDRHIRLEERSIVNQEEDFTYEYRKLLRIYRTELDDMGTYTCLAKAVGVDFAKSASIYLNFTAIPYGTTAFPILAGGIPIWMWLLIPLVLLIILGLILICVYFWRTREKRRQLLLKEQMLEKFKGSHTFLDDGSVNRRSPIRTNEDCDPLLTPAKQRSGQTGRGSTRSVIPDVAQGNPEFVRSFSPEIFSPRPAATAQEKRQFFARQMSEPPISPRRNGSAVSLHHFNANRRQLNAGPQFYSQIHLPPYSSQTLHGRHMHPQNIPMQPIRRPGSAMSLMNPPSDPIYGVAQAKPPHLARQFSAGPAYPPYATMRFNRSERPPSISSFTSEPPMPLESLYGAPAGYVTLPRNHGYSAGGTLPRADSGFGRSLSPTGSNYSSSSVYSTLPRQTRYNRHFAGAIVSDSVGPRTTADGGSSLSLNKLGESPGPIQSKMSSSNPLEDINLGIMSPSNGKVKSRGRLGSSTTPGSLRGRNDFFSFEPIQEVEDSLSKLSSNDIDQILLPKIHTPRNTLESNKYKKKPSPVVNIPPKNRRPDRTYDFIKARADGSSKPPQKTPQDGGETPQLPTSPIPKKPPRSIGSLENIYEEPAVVGNAEGTEV